MKALVFIDRDTGTYIEWDLSLPSQFTVRTAAGELLTTFAGGRPRKIGRARKIAARWWVRNSAHLPIAS